MRVFVQQGQRSWSELMKIIDRTRAVPEENMLAAAKEFRLGWRFTFHQDNNHKHTARATMEGFRSKYIDLTRSLDLVKVQTETLNCCQDLEIDVHLCCLPIFTEFFRRKCRNSVFISEQLAWTYH